MLLPNYIVIFFSSSISGNLMASNPTTMSDVSFQPPAPPSSSSYSSSALPTTVITANTQMTNTSHSTKHNITEEPTNFEIGITTKLPESKSLLLDADIDLKQDTEISPIPVAFTVSGDDLTSPAVATTTAGKKGIVSKSNNSKFAMPKNHWTNAKITSK